MAETTKRRSWQVPPFSGSTPAEVQEWAKQQKDDGIEYFESSPGFEQLEESVRILSGRPNAGTAAKQKDPKYSKLSTNRLKRDLREMVNSLSEIRYNPGYGAGNNDLHATAETLNNVGYFWWVGRFIDLKFKKGIQWMAISPCGWIEICYRTIPGERGKKAIDCIPMSAFDVVMTGVTESGDHQEAYAVTLIKDVPVYLAHALFPDNQNDLKPDRETPNSWYERVRAKAQKVINEVFSGNEPEKTTARNPTCRIYYQYVLDLSINRSGKTMKMGYVKSGSNGTMTESETPWSYDVPSVGESIPVGWEGETQIFRKATADDARIFPGRRLIIFTDTMNKPLYDGPMFDWHGRVPVIKLAADSWPFGDFSMLHDAAPMHEAVNEIDRISHQTLRNRFDPTLLYNMRSVARGDAKAVRLDVQGKRVGYNGAEGNDPMKPLVPHNFNVVEGWVSEFRKYLTDEMDYELGVHQISALSKMKAGAGAGGDQFDKLMDAGPIVKGIARDMERSFRDLADMFMFLVFQYMTTPQIMQIVGPDGVTAENYDFEPGNLIPSHLPGEGDKSKKSVYSQMQRAKWLAEHINFMVTPGTLHEIVQTTQKMMYLQLLKMGFPIDPWSLAEILRIPNFGKPPDGANSMIEKWMAWQKMQMEFKMAMAAEMQGMQPEGNTPGLGPKGGPKGTGGRSSTGAQAPQLTSKDNGSRQTMKESR